MNNHDAKFLLQAYRPGGDDSADPQMAVALDQAARDPQLGEWLARERAFDGVVSEKLRAVTPPAGLREAILAGGRASGASQVARTSKAWWRVAQAQWMGLAAALVLAAATALIVLPRAAEPGLDALAQTALREMQGAHGEPTMAQDAGALGSWLQNPATRFAAGVPMEFGRIKSEGCRVLKVGGREVLEVCFLRDGGEYHFYVGRREDFKIPANGAAPMLVAQGGLATVTWADARNVYVLAGEGDGTALKALL